MKHAGGEALAKMESLLSAIREIPDLTERSPGVFYRRSSAFLHFHEDPAGMFADIKIGKEWQRLPVNNARERAALVRLVSPTASRR